MEEHDIIPLESGPSPREAKKAAKILLGALRDILVRHTAGEPIIAEIAARIEARRNAEADSLIRDASLFREFPASLPPS